VQAGVEALQQLDIEHGRRQIAERQQDVAPDQVVVALTGGVLQLRDLKPLLDRLPDVMRRPIERFRWSAGGAPGRTRNRWEQTRSAESLSGF